MSKMDTIPEISLTLLRFTDLPTHVFFCSHQEILSAENINYPYHYVTSEDNSIVISIRVMALTLQLLDHEKKISML